MISVGVASSRRLWKFSVHKLFRHGFSSASPRDKPSSNRNVDEPRDKWNYNPTSFDAEPGVEYVGYKFVDANILESGLAPPRNVKMLARDFIEDSLYNPNYGYFPKQATIFDTQDSNLDFALLRDSVEFQEEVGRKYAAYGADRHDGPGRQLWHTPTELFKVHIFHSIIERKIIYVFSAVVRTSNRTMSCRRIHVEILSL